MTEKSAEYSDTLPFDCLVVRIAMGSHRENPLALSAYLLLSPVHHSTLEPSHWSRKKMKNLAFTSQEVYEDLVSPTLSKRGL